MEKKAQHHLQVGTFDLHTARVEQSQYDAPGHIKRTRLECPLCRSVMRLKREPGTSKLYYACPRFPECKCTHSAHPNGDPMGRPGTADERRMRGTAHAWFDRIWKGKGRPARRAAYAWLRTTGLPHHISEMTADECARLVELVKTKLGAQGSEHAEGTEHAAGSTEPSSHLPGDADSGPAQRT